MLLQPRELPMGFAAAAADRRRARRVVDEEVTTQNTHEHITTLDPVERLGSPREDERLLRLI
jgi:hypothetical protein